MCLYIKNVKYDDNMNPKPLIARNDMICYKVLRYIGSGDFVTPYQYAVVRIGQNMSAPSFGFYFDKVNQGIHAHVKKSVEVWSDEVLVECVIPKDTPYFKGTHDDIVALKMKLKKIIKRYNWIKGIYYV